MGADVWLLQVDNSQKEKEEDFHFENLYLLLSLAASFAEV